MSTLLSKTGTWLFGSEGDIIVEGRVQVMVLAASILVTGAVVVSPLISDLAKVFEISEARAGLLMIVIAAPQPILVPLAGMIADQFGRKPVFVSGLLIFGLAGGAISLATSFEMVLACRFLQGIGFSAAMPMTIVLFGDFYDGTRETTAQSFRMVGINSIYVISPVVAGMLFLFSWRAPFLLYLLSVPIAIAAWIILPNSKPSEIDSVGVYIHNLIQGMKSVTVALYLLSFALRFVLLFGFMTYISVLAINHLGFAITLVGTIVSIKGAISLIGATQVGRLVDRSSPSHIVVGGFVLAGIGITSMGIVSTMFGLFIATAVFGIGDGLISPAQKSTINQIVPHHLRGGIMSTAVAFQNMGKIIGPSIFALSIIFLGPANTFQLLGLVGGALGALVVSFAYIVS